MTLQPYEYNERIDIYEPIYNLWPPLYQGFGQMWMGMAQAWMGAAQACFAIGAYSFEKANTMTYVRDQRLADPNRWNDPRADGTRRWR